MQGHKTYQPKMLYQVQLHELVPQDNFYRKLMKFVDFNFLYKQTAQYYGTEGQESIDPVVFFKICIVGYLNNITSDRRLIEYCSNCLDIRLFLLYDIDEPLPWHSTISRTRQLYSEEVFLNLFKQILSKCIEAGMVRGKRQAIDSAYIKANASMDSIVEKEILEDADDYMEELNEQSEYKISSNRICPQDKSRGYVSPQKNKEVNQHHEWKKEEYKAMPGHTDSQRLDENGHLIRPRFLSNHTHHSPTDRDARISTKPGKPRQLNYSAQISVDDAHHIITGACADYADKRDSESLSHIVDQTKINLAQNDIKLDQIVADTGYSSGEALQYCEINDIDAYIPNFGQYKNERPGFIYNDALNQYECQRGNRAVLTFKGRKIDSKGYSKHTYRSSETDCKNCPFREECCGKTTKFKKLDDSVHKPLYDLMHEKMQSKYAKRISKIRSKTVEPVLGHLINYLGMKRIQARGIKAAVKHVLMASLCHNLKRLMKHIGKVPQIHVNIAIKTLKAAQNSFKNYFLMMRYIIKYQMEFRQI
jgi:transposase